MSDTDNPKATHWTSEDPEVQKDTREATKSRADSALGPVVEDAPQNPALDTAPATPQDKPAKPSKPGKKQ